MSVLDAQPWAEEAAWQALTRSGLPLIADHPADPGLHRVTFAWRGYPGVQAVRLDSVLNAPHIDGVVSDYREDFTLPLARLNGSDIWTLTIDAARDVQASYSFLVETENGWRREGDRINPRQLRGEESEAVFLGDRVSGQAHWRPLPHRLHRMGDGHAIDSRHLDRTVFLKLYPAQRAQADTPVLILYDSFLWGVRQPAWEIVRNLADGGLIPDMHVVLIDQLDPNSAETAYRDQAGFVADELLPELQRLWQQDLPPEQVVLAGASRRGLSAALTALDRPDRVGNALSLSGSFYWAPEGEPPEWTVRHLTPASADSARFHLAAGSLEYVQTSTNRGHVMLATNQRMAEALRSAGYEADLQVFAGGHDIAGWRAGLAAGLVRLVGEADD